VSEGVAVRRWPRRRASRWRSPSSSGSLLTTTTFALPLPLPTSRQLLSSRPSHQHPGMSLQQSYQALQQAFDANDLTSVGKQLPALKVRQPSAARGQQLASCLLVVQHH
jgi:hypothetical protein